MTWSLVSAEDRAAEHPKTFSIPSREIRASLEIGDVAKLIFASPSGNERMWVEIVFIDRASSTLESERYRGQLRNHPTTITELDYDDEVTFGPEHVADWASGDMD